MKNFEIIDVNYEDVKKYGVGCSKNPRHKGFQAKHKWLKDRYKEGLKIKILLFEGKQEGFIEYIPGKNCWRGIEAPGYYVIHCVYIKAKKAKNKGLGSQLIQSCIDDAKENNKLGVTALVSDGSFLASQEIFKKNGFKIKKGPQFSDYEIAYLKLRDGIEPAFPEDKKPLAQYEGIHILFSNQCPYVAKYVSALEATAVEQGFEPIVKEIKTAKEARRLPSPYGVFMIIYNGKIKAEHYISTTRFRNILTKELES